MRPLDSGLSRRDFLKLGGVGLAGLLAPPPRFPLESAYAGQQGRVIAKVIWTYERPSYDAPRLKMFWRDLVLPITNATISEDVAAHNRVWYEIGADGYAYSGNIQPVRTTLNQPQPDIPGEGVLAEVSVPYTDAHQAAKEASRVAYRMYYESTHWVRAAVRNPDDGQVWYQVWDDKWNERYFAPGEHLRLIPPEELSPLSPDISETRKRIEVSLSDQLVIAYEYDQPVFAARAATGGTYRLGRYTTPRGQFITYYKRPTRHMASGDIAASGYDLPGVPWVSYLTENGISFHGTYWHNDFGRPRSHGCINLTPQSAKWLYRWTLPPVPPGQEFAYRRGGTQVEIRT